jgi:hypothetical protein|uniref:Uncharacterized protein n=1 Tax=Zea mays TaxID=4577 RepID=A0A804RIA9_MAIZE
MLCSKSKILSWEEVAKSPPLPSLAFFSWVGSLPACLPPPPGSDIWSRRELNGGKQQQAAVEQQDPADWGDDNDTEWAEQPAAAFWMVAGGPRSRPNRRQQHGGGDFWAVLLGVLGLSRAPSWVGLSGPARHGWACVVPCSDRRVSPSGGTARPD